MLSRFLLWVSVVEARGGGDLLLFGTGDGHDIIDLRKRATIDCFNRCEIERCGVT